MMAFFDKGKFSYFYECCIHEKLQRKIENLHEYEMIAVVVDAVWCCCDMMAEPLGMK